MKRRGVAIVGGGQAASQLAVALRERGYDEPVTIIGEERYWPYQRPPLSKAFLSGRADADTLALRSPGLYASKDIEVLTGTRVEQAMLDPTLAGGTVRLSSGDAIDFSHLVLAVGAAPRRLTVPGHDSDGVLYLRDIADALALKAGLDRCRDVVVVGGGFIGLEAAAVARARGCNVTVVEYAERLMARAVAPQVSQFYREAHERRGTRVLVSSEVVAFEAADGCVRGVVLADGRTLPADLVVVGIGIHPRVELAQHLGIRCEGGIVVDESARTSNPVVLAVGDCTVAEQPDLSGELLGLESVQNAVDQADRAAATLTGQGPVPRATPWFWSDQDTLKLQIAGLSSGYDQTILRGDPAQEKFSLFYYRRDQLIAVDAINSPREFMAVRRALTEGRNISSQAAADTTNNLRSSREPNEARVKSTGGRPTDGRPECGGLMSSSL